ncbi:MAG: hypothetical protein AAF399_20365, partial [Bacteroidota bacterium]
EKLQLHKKIKQIIQPQLEDPNLILDAFIVSPTRFAELTFWKGQDHIKDFNAQHVFFQKDQTSTYLQDILLMALRESG